jgi:hypothetical protein
MKMARSQIPGGKGYVMLNYLGMGELLKSPQIQAILRQRMAPVQSALDGSELQIMVGRNRARAKVIRGSDYEEANTGELSRALDLSGGSRGTRVKTTKKPTHS